MAVGMRTGLARMGHGLSGSRSGLAGLVYMMRHGSGLAGLVHMMGHGSGLAGLVYMMGHGSGLAGLDHMMGLRTGLTRMLGAMVSGALSKSHSAGHESGYNEDLFHS